MAKKVRKHNAQTMMVLSTSIQLYIYQNTITSWKHRLQVGISRTSCQEMRTSNNKMFAMNQN